MLPAVILGGIHLTSSIQFLSIFCSHDSELFLFIKPFGRYQDLDVP